MFLYWVDIKSRGVHRFDPATGRDTRWPTPEEVGSLARRAAGGVVAALRTGFHLLDLDTGAVTPAAQPERDRAENRFNDGKPDRRGRFWAGSMHDPETAPTGPVSRLGQSRPGRDARVDPASYNLIAASLAIMGVITLPPERRDA